MYRAKELGRNQAQLFTASMNERYVRRLALEEPHSALALPLPDLRGEEKVGRIAAADEIDGEEQPVAGQLDA